MSEQPTDPPRPGTAEKSPSAAPGTDAEQHGHVRTEGETTVDEAIGTGDNVH